MPLYNFGVGRKESSLYNFGLGRTGVVAIILKAVANICRAIVVPFEQRIEKIDPDC